MKFNKTKLSRYSSWSLYEEPRANVRARLDPDPTSPVPDPKIDLKELAAFCGTIEQELIHSPMQAYYST